MQSLKVKDLIPHPKNEYFFDDMTGQKYEEFRESIRTSGVIEPLIVTQDMVIVSGHQRSRCCIDEGIETVMWMCGITPIRMAAARKTGY